MIARAAIFLLAAALVSDPSFAAEGRTGVSRVEGQVGVVRSSGSVPASRGERLLAGDEVVTKEDSTADIQWNGLWGCRMLENTRMKIVGLDLEDQRVRLEEGGILFKLEKLPKKSAFRLETATGVAAVRGTQFLALEKITDEGEVVTIAVRRGSVEVIPASEGVAPLTLNAGQAVDLAAVSKPAAPRELTEDEKKILGAASAINTGKQAGRDELYKR